MNASNLSLSSPAGRASRGHIPPYLNAVPPGRVGQRDPGPYNMSPISPDLKRRRTNTSSGLYLPPTGRSEHSGSFPLGMPPGRRESLPRPDQLLRHSPTTSMGPPPRPGRIPMSPPSSRSTMSHGSEYLTLPPIQSITSDQSRSVEAMVMSMPFLGKIKILRKITPPLKASRLGSPGGGGTRGAVIAIEGEDRDAVHKLTHWLEDFLSRSGDEYHPKIADSPLQPSLGESDSVTLGDYIGVIKEWHSRSVEMASFITTSPTAASTPGSGRGSRDDDQDTLSPRQRLPHPRPQPVLLLPNYQLATSDAYACQVPINDSYSPADHWQWMATMWRGILGPDITVYIKEESGEDAAREREKMVDVKEEVKCLVVSKVKGHYIEERALRRVGFEVGEWVRALGVPEIGSDRTE